MINQQDIEILRQNVDPLGYKFPYKGNRPYDVRTLIMTAQNLIDSWSSKQERIKELEAALNNERGTLKELREKQRAAARNLAILFSGQFLHLAGRTVNPDDLDPMIDNVGAVQKAMLARKRHIDNIKSIRAKRSRTLAEITEMKSTYDFILLRSKALLEKYRMQEFLSGERRRGPVYIVIDEVSKIPEQKRPFCEPAPFPNFKSECIRDIADFSGTWGDAATFAAISQGSWNATDSIEISAKGRPLRINILETSPYVKFMQRGDKQPVLHVKLSAAQHKAVLMYIDERVKFFGVDMNIFNKYYSKFCLLEIEEIFPAGTVSKDCIDECYTRIDMMIFSILNIDGISPEKMPDCYKKWVDNIHRLPRNFVAMQFNDKQYAQLITTEKRLQQEIGPACLDNVDMCTIYLANPLAPEHSAIDMLAYEARLINWATDKTNI